MLGKWTHHGDMLIMAALEPCAVMKCLAGEMPFKMECSLVIIKLWLSKEKLDVSGSFRQKGPQVVSSTVTDIWAILEGTFTV